MATNNTTQGRSMNNIIDFDGIENLNVDNIIAENIVVDNLQIESSLLVDNTTITPQELSFIQNASSNIQTQINNISNNFVTLDTTQTIIGNKTFSGTTTLTGNLDVSGISITPQEISFLDGLQSNIQTQLDNAGITNSVTLNTDQVITGKKTFTQKINIPSVEVSDQSAVLKGFITDTTNLAYSNIQGTTPALNSTTLVGTGVNSTITTNDIRAGTTGGDFTLSNISTPTTSIQNVDAYLSTRGANTDNYTFENTTLIQDQSGNDFFSGLKWLSSSQVTIPVFINDFVSQKNGFDIQMVSNSSNNVLPNTSQVSGYVFDSNTFITNDAIDERFLEGSGLIRPVKITSISNNRVQISSPNQITPTPSNDNVIGYFHDSNTIYYYLENGNALVLSFIKGNSLNGSANITSKDISLNSLTIQNNSHITPSILTKVGYIYFYPDTQENIIVFEDGNGLQQFQFVENVGITLGNHYINTLTSNYVVLDTQDMVSTPILHDGYLFTSSVLVSNDISLNSFIVSPPDIPDISQTRASTLNATFVNLSTSNNTPTPNNKTYNGFSLSETEFYYNNDDTNVDIDYYLKNNAIQIPTTDHLITSVDTANKKLTTANLPIASPTLSVNGYTNITLNSIITETAQSINVGNGIDSTLINTSSRFVSFVNGVEIKVSGTLNSVSHAADILGFIQSNNKAIVTDVNNRLVVNNFFIDYNLNTLPDNAVIQSITNLNDNFKQVTFSPSSGVVTAYTNVESFKPNANQIFMTSSSQQNNFYSITYSSLIYAKLLTTFDNNGYTTTDTTFVSPIFTKDNSINVLLEDGTIVVLFGDLKPQFLSGFFNKYYTYSGYAENKHMLKVTSSQVTQVQNALQTTSPFNSGSYLNFNYTPALNNDNPNEIPGSQTFGYIYQKNGYYFWIQYSSFGSIYQYHDYIFEKIPGVAVNNRYTARKTRLTGCWIDNKTTGSAYNIGFRLDNPPPIYTTTAERGFIRVAQNYAGNVTQFLAFNSPLNPLGSQYLFSGSGNNYNFATILNVQNQGNGTSLVTLGQGFPVGSINNFILTLFNKPGGINPTNIFGLRPANQLANFITPQTASIVVSSNNYQSIAPTNVNIYSGIDSYNSYEKKTFQEYIPSDFELFNTQTVDSVIPTNFDTFEKLNFNVYNLDTFIGQTFYDVGFPNNVDDEVFVLQDTVQVLTNKTLSSSTLTGNIDCVNTELSGNIDCVNTQLLAPTISNVTINGLGYSPTFTSPIIFLNHPSQTSFFYTNQMVFRTGDPGSNIFFNSTSTQVIGRNFSVQPGIFGLPVFVVDGNHVKIGTGNYVSIGTTLKQQLLHVNGNILLNEVTNGYQQRGSRYIGFGSGNGAVGIDGFTGIEIQGVAKGAGSSQKIRFWTHDDATGTGGTPRMVIEPNGYVGIGTTNPQSSLSFHGLTGGNGVLQVVSINKGRDIDGAAFKALSDNNFIMSFWNRNNGYRGRIGGNGANAVSYQTSSDRRLKTNVKDMSSMIETIKLMKPVVFDWISSNEKGDGFIAQDIFKLFPLLKPSFECFESYCDVCNCDFDEENPLNKDGTNLVYGLDYGKFTPYLTKGLQEVIIKVESLEDKNILLQKQIETLQETIKSLITLNGLSV